MTPEPQPVIAVISNRNSGHNRDRLGAVAAALDGDPRFRHFITEAAEDIPGVLGMLAGTPLRLLVINGGDGTAAAVFARLFAHFPPRSEETSRKTHYCSVRCRKSVSKRAAIPTVTA